MDYTGVLKRAWSLVRHYRALWFFGIILALVTAGGSAPNNRGIQYTFRNEYLFGGRPLRPQDFPPEAVGALLAIVAGVICLLLIFAVVATVARYVMETALIRMVDDHEATGERRSVREGLRLGWSRTALRLFLIDLAIGLPAFVLFLSLLVIAALPLLLWATETPFWGVLGTIGSLSLALVVVLLALVAGVILAVMKRLFRRACAIEQLGVVDSIRRGYDMAKRHTRDVTFMWLITLGLDIGWVIVMIPVTFLLVAIGGVIGGLPALLVGRLASLMSGSGAIPWILGLVIGIAIFILVVTAPLALLGGLWKVFRSSIWTLTYRDLCDLESQAS